MLSIGKVGGGNGDPRYYIDNVAQGKEDYYSGRGEAQGQWLGSAAKATGLTGTVDDDQFLALLSSQPANPRKVLAYDLTFSTPKSVSVLFGVGDRTLAPVVRDAHDLAVEEALGYVERHATWTRRGSGGHRVLRGDGLQVAAFRHRSSRAGDPQLHTHAVIANATTVEGRATTLDGHALYAHARTAGYLYEAALRRRLTEALGAEWEPAGKASPRSAASPASSQALLPAPSRHRRAPCRDRWTLAGGGRDRRIGHPPRQAPGHRRTKPARAVADARRGPGLRA